MSLVRDITYLLDSIQETGWRTDNSSYTAYYSQSNDNEHVIEVPLVGMSRENLKVDVQEGVLTIEAVSDLKSRFVRNFKQTWNLTKDSDVENVNAKLDNGLLIVRVPRTRPAKKVVNIAVN